MILFISPSVRDGYKIKEGSNGIEPILLVQNQISTV